MTDQDGPTEYAVNANKLRHINSTMCLRSEVVQSLVCSVNFHPHRQFWLGIGSPVSARKMTQLGGCSGGRGTTRQTRCRLRCRSPESMSSLMAELLKYGLPTPKMTILLPMFLMRLTHNGSVSITAATSGPVVSHVIQIKSYFLSAHVLLDINSTAFLKSFTSVVLTPRSCGACTVPLPLARTQAAQPEPAGPAGQADPAIS